jgi:nucleotide-binding universal stress UspA family protein
MRPDPDPSVMDPAARLDPLHRPWPTGHGPGTVVGSGIRRILLATDLGPASTAAVDHALALAAALGASLVVASVVEPGRPIPGVGGRVDQLREAREGGVRRITDQAQSLGIRATFLVWLGEAGPSVVAAAEAEGADLIVVGSHGRAGVARLLLGSVSDHVIRHASCPVLVVPPGDDPPAS